MKHLIATATIVLSAISCLAQNNTVTDYHINGICSPETKKIFIINRNGAQIDSTETQNGKFQIKGKDKKDAFLGILANGRYITFINDGTPVKADMKSMNLEGSPLNVKLNGYEKQFTTMTDELTSFAEKYSEAGNNKSQEEFDALCREYKKNHFDPIFKKMTELTKKIVKENPDNFIPAIFVKTIIYSCDYNDLKYLKLDELFDEDYTYLKHPIAIGFKSHYDKLAKELALIGTQFKDLEMNDTDGKTHKLSEYCGKGNYVFVDFWASWCGPCRGEIPNVKANYDKYHSKGFEIVGLSFDNNEEAWKKAIEEMELKWINLSDLMGWKSIAASIYGIKSIPSSLLIDPEGKIVAIDLRAYLLGDKLKEIYGF